VGPAVLPDWLQHTNSRSSTKQLIISLGYGDLLQRDLVFDPIRNFRFRTSDCTGVPTSCRIPVGPLPQFARARAILVDSTWDSNEIRIDLRTVTNTIEQQETITRDSVTVKVNAVLWFRVADPKKAVLTVENFRSAVQQVALTSLRNVIGQHDLDEVLKERDKINALLKRNVLENTNAWGVTVELLEMKDVEIPQDMQRVMAMEAEAMREKRARIIKADADAAQLMVGNPAALELRRMQMVAEVGAENNSTTVIMFPADFVHFAGSLSKFLEGKPGS
jgi:hypothetical protein